MILSITIVTIVIELFLIDSFTLGNSICDFTVNVVQNLVTIYVQVVPLNMSCRLQYELNNT